MKQVKLNDWDFIDRVIQTRKAKRINWKKYFGCSLTKAITLHRNLGRHSTQTFKILANKLLEYGKPTEKVLKRLEISVRARYCEQGSYNKRVGLL